MRIESSISRQIGGMQSSGEEDEDKKSAIAGKCPDCGEVTAVNKLASGEIEASCAIVGCNGVGAPGDKCSVCGTRISSRVICTVCNTSAPVDSHFSDDEAW
jgi:ribosomal protein L32